MSCPCQQLYLQNSPKFLIVGIMNDVLSFLLASLFYIAFHVYLHDYPAFFSFLQYYLLHFQRHDLKVGLRLYFRLLGLVEGDLSYLNKLKDFLLKATFINVMPNNISMVFISFIWFVPFQEWWLQQGQQSRGNLTITQQSSVHFTQ